MGQRCTDTLNLNGPLSSDNRFNHGLVTGGTIFQTRPRSMDFKGDKNPLEGK